MERSKQGRKEGWRNEWRDKGLRKGGMNDVEMGKWKDEWRNGQKGGGW